MKDKALFELVVVLILVGFGLWFLKKDSTPTPAYKDYTDALVIYKGARIELDENCQANPSSVTYKNGTSIMIDNRASVDRVVKVGSSFPIKAQSFEIVKLSSETLPIIWNVDCDQSKNVAQILIQKK